MTTITKESKQEKKSLPEYARKIADKMFPLTYKPEYSRGEVEQLLIEVCAEANSLLTAQKEKIRKAYLSQQDNYGAEPEFAEAGWKDLLGRIDNQALDDLKSRVTNL